jgi:hypothetical protein
MGASGKNLWSAVPQRRSNIDAAADIMNHDSLALDDKFPMLEYDLFIVTSGDVGPGCEDLFHNSFSPLELITASC